MLSSSKFPDPDRFKARAAREMAGMFDDVVPRYDLLNTLMTLGRDRTWRDALAHAVPENALVVLDLCTGNGVSVEGLRRTGRTVVGLDVSLGMLRQARAGFGHHGWAPRFACADAFAIPVADGGADAVTIAFGMRNLRPRSDVLAEIIRVLRPGGILAVLEAAAPRPGPIGAVHGFWLRHGVPLLGRLSPDPTAYRYLSQSVFEFGTGDTFERDAEAAGFEPVGARRFMLGAAGLWVARKPPAAGAAGSSGADVVQNATGEWAKRGDLPQTRDPREAEWRLWTGFQLLVSVAILATLILGFQSFVEWGPGASVAHWQRSGMRTLLVLGMALFAFRSLVLLVRLLGPPPRR